MATEQHRPSDTSTLAEGQKANDEGSRLSKDEQRRASSDGGEKQQRRSNDDEEKQQPQKPDNDEEEKDPNLVDWDGPDDPENPMNWSNRKKWTITIVLGITTLCVTFASSVFSTAITPTSQEFGVSEEVMILGVSLFVLGFAFGPIVFAPLSELFGRKLPLFIPFAIFAIFQIPVAVAQNLETIMICRFLGGFFASSPLAIVGGTLADYFGPVERGVAIVTFAAATFLGPTIAPIIGGFVTMSYLGWRWTAWLTLIMAAAFGIVGVFVVPETSGPVILQKRAKKLRFETKNWALHSQLDTKQVNAKELVETYLLRPLMMLVMEPILILITIYMGLIYGILYLFFEVFPIVFQQQRGWNAGVGALPFLGILVGVIMGGTFIAVFTETRYARRLKEEGTVVPEERLIPMIVGGFLLPIGLFWFAWTSSPAITPWPQIIACAPIGMGVLMIFLQGLNYLIDVYKMNANSSIAANSLVRSSLGAGFPMFATAMFNNLGVPWATSLLGFLTVALVPVPILFYIYGEKIRKLSKFSPDS